MMLIRLRNAPLPAALVYATRRHYETSKTYGIEMRLLQEADAASDRHALISLILGNAPLPQFPHSPSFHARRAGERQR